ncbi:E3 ubiquitin ISG15 ligase TRIM25-like [Pelobates cultripes]|uniref:E3 ubiquitin ISG15 ligase TRIM25-like n=1 Tax=Pelobates cultripes TaxID=61616 RepID=A0AAD1RL10_PELCU|nr:E3 ubiquitin ISG15 ligase TRIM25-like [Pelobates cultripes]
MAAANFGESLKSNQNRCRYCTAFAKRLCLDCEAYLCRDHLEPHNLAGQHTLTELSTNLQTRKCATHQKLLKYNCCVDNVYVCEFCVLLGVHKGHNVELISDKSKALKSSLEELVEKLIKQTAQIVQSMDKISARRDETHERATVLINQVTAIFMDLKKQLENEEKKIKGEISKQVDEVDLQMSKFFLKKKGEQLNLSAQVAEIESFRNSTDPITILEKGPNSINKANKVIIREIEGNVEVTGLNELLVLVNLESSLLRLVKSIPQLQRKHGFQVQNQILMMPTNATKNNGDQLGNLLNTSVNLNKVIYSSTAISSGQHYLEVDTGDFPSWSIGVSYSRDEDCVLGDKTDSWCLRYYKMGKYAVVHNGVKTLVSIVSPIKALGIYLDYEAGNLCFLELVTPIKQLYTILVRFDYPLYFAFCMSERGILSLR